MKKNLFFSILTGVLLTSLLSFNVIGSNDNMRTHKKAKAAKSKCFSCSVTISTLNGSGGTFNWTVPTGSVVDHYNYGGYYQAGGTFSGSTTGLSTSITPKSGGGRFSVTPICADGTAGTGMNILF